MGVDAADYDGDGWTDLFLANVDREMYSLYHNNHNNTFDDEAMSNGIGKSTRLLSGWGLKFFDFDNDGTIDLFLANGHPDDRVETRDNDVQYSEPMLLFRNTGNGFNRAFETVSSQARPAFSQRFASPALAIRHSDPAASLHLLR